MENYFKKIKKKLIISLLNQKKFKIIGIVIFSKKKFNSNNLTFFFYKIQKYTFFFKYFLKLPNNSLIINFDFLHNINEILNYKNLYLYILNNLILDNNRLLNLKKYVPFFLFFYKFLINLYFTLFKLLHFCYLYINLIFNYLKFK